MTTFIRDVGAGPDHDKTSSNDGHASTPTRPRLTGRALMIYRQNHGGRGPNDAADAGGSAVKLTGRAGFLARSNNGGRR